MRGEDLRERGLHGVLLHPVLLGRPCMASNRESFDEARLAPE